MSVSTTAQAIGRNPEVVEPLGNYLTVRLYSQEEMSVGGILLPEQSRDKQVLAKVIAVGQGQRNILDGAFMGCLCKKDDTVIVLKHAPVEVKLGGESFHVVFEGDIIGRINDEKLREAIAQMESNPKSEFVSPTPTVTEPTSSTALYETQRPSGVVVVERGK